MPPAILPLQNHYPRDGRHRAALEAAQPADRRQQVQWRARGCRRAGLDVPGPEEQGVRDTAGAWAKCHQKPLGLDASSDRHAHTQGRHTRYAPGWPAELPRVLPVPPSTSSGSPPPQPRSPTRASLLHFVAFNHPGMRRVGGRTAASSSSSSSFLLPFASPRCALVHISSSSSPMSSCSSPSALARASSRSSPECALALVLSSPPPFLLAEGCTRAWVVVFDHARRLQLRPLLRVRRSHGL